ncbi:TPA: hypothetical protein U1C94_001384 [Streptococcus suis]|nr:hypothetical protein [Streptococcus suis]
MDKKTCFVVSAIGEENSEIRDHSDSVLNYIIKPALDAKYDVKRADELYHSDRIDDKIFDALSTSDLVIVDITGNNPNVFLELGFRKALNLPTIFLRQKTEEPIPFDIRTINTIHYDLKNPNGKAMLDSVKETINRIKKTEENIDFTVFNSENNNENVTTQEFIQLKTSINNIYNAIEQLADKIENNTSQNRPMTQEDLIMMAFQEPEKLEKIFELQAKYPNAFQNNANTSNALNG